MARVEGPPPRYPLRYELLDRWPWVAGAAVVVAIAVVAVVLLTGGESDSGSPQEQAATRAVNGFLEAVSSGDEQACERFIDLDAPGIVSYLRLTEGVRGQATCGFVGAGDERAALTVDQVTVQGSQATATLAGSPTVIHLSDTGGEWVIDAIR
jgi:hypothetical protein